MIQSGKETYLFRLGRRAHKRMTFFAYLMLSSFLTVAGMGVLLASRIFPTYSHAFTPYFKWQDMLVIICCYISFVALWGSILVGRFLHALHMGYRKEMLTLVDDSALIVRDLSPENLLSIFGLMTTALSCFAVLIVGLIPEILIGWTLQMPNVALAVFSTTVALLLGIGGLGLSLPAGSFIVIGIVGSFSYCRKMGSRQIYRLTDQTTLTIDNFVLTILYPDAPESMLDLKLLDADDQRQLLSLLHKRWLAAERPWNPLLGEEITAALEEAERQISLV